MQKKNEREVLQTYRERAKKVASEIASKKSLQDKLLIIVKRSLAAEGIYVICANLVLQLS